MLAAQCRLRKITKRERKTVYFWGGLAAVDVTRWDERADIRTGCGVRSQVIYVLEAQIKRRTGNEEG
jgi:hypothetical protein